MNNKYNCAIVIPVYKSFSDLCENEMISLQSSCKFLSEYAHVLAGPQNLNWDEYKSFYLNLGITIQIVHFEKKYFADIPGYNELLKSVHFYEGFAKYTFILIFQPDAYIFKDELDYWCGKNYDFIGAPWFENLEEANAISPMISSGNGGLSLRKVSSTLRILKRINLLKRLRIFWYKSHLQSIIRFDNLIVWFQTIFKIKSLKNLNIIFFENYFYEDKYWAEVIPDFFTDYKVAPVEEAIKFSFEVNPSLLFKLNNNELPFGCHAWEKYELEFWKRFIIDRD